MSERIRKKNRDRARQKDGQNRQEKKRNRVMEMEEGTGSQKLANRKEKGVSERESECSKEIRR